MSAQYPDPQRQPVQRYEPARPFPWRVLGFVVTFSVPLGLVVLLLMGLNTCVNQLRESYFTVSQPAVAQAQAHQRQVEADARAAEIERQRAQDAVWQPRIEAVKGLALLTLWFAIPATFLGLGFFLYKRALLPPSDGRPDRLRWSDEQRWLSWQQHQERLTAAANMKPVPLQLSTAQTFAPRIEFAPTQVGPASIPTPSLDDLLKLPGLVYGLGESAPVSLDGEIPSSSIGGIPKSGKSNTASFLAAQIAAKGGQLWVGDPHANHQARSLSAYLSRFGTPQIAGPDHGAILEMVAAFHGEWDRRRTRPGKDWAWEALVLDEWTELLKGEAGKRLPDLLADIIRGGSKFGMMTFLLSQNWAANQSGGTALRNLIPIQIAHRMRQQDLRMLTGAAAESLPADTGELPTGTAYIFGHPDGTQRIRVPEVPVPAASQVVEGAESAPTDASQGEINPQDARVLELFKQGQDIAEIVKEVYGASGGRNYQKAAREVQAAIRRCT